MAMIEVVSGLPVVEHFITVLNRTIERSNRVSRKEDVRGR